MWAGSACRPYGGLNPSFLRAAGPRASPANPQDWSRVPRALSCVQPNGKELAVSIISFVAYYRPDDYQPIKSIFPNHPDFPDAYDEWFYLARKRLLEAQSRGHIVQEVVVDPNQFARFCDRTGRKRDLAALDAFLFEEAARQGDTGTPHLLRGKGGRPDGTS
jgi:hypothetical protein